jgi:hypothetical protein
MNAHRIPVFIAATLSLIALSAFSSLSCRPAAAQEEIKVSGEILDMSCYLSKGSRGARHKTCAKMCAEKGLPIGVITESGDVYLLLEDHDNPDPYDALKKLAGGNAEVGGKKFTRSGMQSILVQEAKGF